MSDVKGCTGWAQAGLGVATFAYTYAVWSSFGPMAFFPHIDMTASFVLARDCAEGRGCTMEILPDGLVSILGFVLGAIANHLAALVHAATGDFRGLEPLVQVMFALAAAVTSIAAARRAGLFAGLVAYLIFMRFPVLEGLYRVQWTILMYHFLPLFCACAALFGIWRANGGGVAALLLTALAVSLAAQTHQTGFALVPSLLALAWMGEPGFTRRLARVAAALVAFFAAYALASYGVLVHFDFGVFAAAMATLHQQHALLFPMLVAALAAIAALTTADRVAGRPLPRDLIYLTAAALPLAPIALLPSVNTRYAFAFAPAFAALGGILAALAIRQLAHLAVRIGAPRILAELPGSPLPAIAMVPIIAAAVPVDEGPHWRDIRAAIAGVATQHAPSAAGERLDRPIGVFDLEPALRALAAELGGTYADAFRRVRVTSPLHRELLGTLAMYWPLDAEAPPSTRRDAAVLAAPPGFRPPEGDDTWRTVATTSRYDLAVQVFSPYVDTAVIAWQAAHSHRPPGRAWRTIEFLPSKAELMSATYRWRMMPDTFDLAYPRDVPPGSDRILLRFALRLPADAAPRALVLQANAAPHQRHAIERIEGVPYAGSLPGLVAVVSGGEIEQQGFIEVSITGEGGGAVDYLGVPPPIFEIEPSSYAALLPALATIDSGERMLPAFLEPIPPLPLTASEMRFAPLRSLTDAGGRAITVDTFFTPDGKRPDAHVPSDVTAPFPFVAAVMGLFAVLLAGGIVVAAPAPANSTKQSVL